MALTGAHLEKALRRLMALDTRWLQLMSVLGLLKQGNFSIPGLPPIPLSAGQKNGLTTAISTLVVAIETTLAGLETLVRETTDVIPGVAGPGITNPSLALDAALPLTSQEWGSQTRQKLVQDMTSNLDASRDADGELSADVLTAADVNALKELFGVRIDKSKLVLAQLRALGA